MKNIDWKILKVLYEKRSITKAADALFMTQSALTKRLQSIESEWGRQLVERTSRGVTFTEDGKYLVQKANIMLDFLQEIGDKFCRPPYKDGILKTRRPELVCKAPSSETPRRIPEKRSQSLYQDNFQLQRRDLKGSDRRYDRYRSRLRRFPVSR